MLMIQQIFDFLHISRCTYDFTDVSYKFTHMLNVKISLLIHITTMTEQINDIKLTPWPAPDIKYNN